VVNRKYQHLQGGDNMQFIYGLLTSVVFFIALLGFFYMGYKHGRKTHVPKFISEEEQRKQEKMQTFDKHFKALFSYDVDTATAKKKVK
jgi:hypothetical protein